MRDDSDNFSLCIHHANRTHLLLSQILRGSMNARFFGDGEDFSAGPYQVGNLHCTLPEFMGRILGLFLSGCKMRPNPTSDSVKRHLPIEYAADLTPVVAAKEARASWNARGMAETA